MPIFMDDLKALALVGTLKIAGVYVALIVLMAVVLAFRVIFRRRGALIGIGDGGDKILIRRTRIHGNFIENATLVLPLLILLPLIGASTWAVHAVGVLFLAGRVAHAFGLSQSAGSSLGRVAGMISTFTALLIGAVSLLLAAFRG
jgi:uncharacterized protein